MGNLVNRVNKSLQSFIMVANSMMKGDGEKRGMLPSPLSLAGVGPALPLGRVGAGPKSWSIPEGYRKEVVER